LCLFSLYFRRHSTNPSHLGLLAVFPLNNHAVVQTSEPAGDTFQILRPAFPSYMMALHEISRFVVIVDDVQPQAASLQFCTNAFDENCTRDDSRHFSFSSCGNEGHVQQWKKHVMPVQAASCTYK
jgi:hypothetical protein